MTESNTSNSVRDRISAIVGAQETTEAQEVQKVDVEVKKKQNNKRLFVILGSVFGVIIIGLVIAIVVVKLWPKEGEITPEEIIANKDNNTVEAVEQRVNRGAAAVADCDEIASMYNTVTNEFSVVTDAFDKKMLSSDPVYNVYFAICYAGFVSSFSGDYERSATIMKETESQLENVNTRNAIDYYVALRSIYKLTKNEEGIASCNSKIIELMESESDGEGDGDFKMEMMSDEQQ